MAVSRKKKIIIAVAAVAVLGLIVVVSILARGKDEPEVTVVKVETRPELKSTVTASGEVRPIRFVNLTSEVQGRIVEINVNPGDHVTTGQPLVRVDPTQLESSAEAQAAGAQAALSDVQNARSAVLSAETNVQQAQAALAASEAQLAQARQAVNTAQTSVDREQVNLATAQRELKRTTDLIESGVASRSEYDTAQDRVKQARVSLNTAQAQLKSAEMTTINVEVNVDETEIAQVEEGQVAKVKVDALGEREIEGTVIQKNPLAVSRSDTQGSGLGNRVNVQEAKEFKVVIELKNLPDEARNSLKPGMTATATVATKTKQNVLAVPLQAIVETSPSPTPTPAGQPQGQQPAATPVGEKLKEIKGVYVLDGRKAKCVPVETGITGESDIEVVSGLQPNMEVITGPSRVLRTLKDGDTVKKQENKPGTAAGEEKK